MTERDVLLDVARRLDRLRLPYMLTGSLASMYYGVARFTHDIDLVIQIPPRDAPQLVAEFRPDYFADEQMIQEAHRGTFQFNLLHQETGVKVDFWLVRPDPFHRTMFERRRAETVWGQRVWICTAEDVVLHKLYWNKLSPSERQLNDVRGVIRVRDDKLDWAYIETWAEQLSVAPTLRKLRSHS